MAINTVRAIILRDADMNTTVIREDNGLLFNYDFPEFILFLAEPHLDTIAIADISDSTIRDTDPMLTPFGCDEERFDALESWDRMLTFREYTYPHSKESAPVFLRDFNKIWAIAEREGLVLGG